MTALSLSLILLIPLLTDVVLFCTKGALVLGILTRQAGEFLTPLFFRLGSGKFGVKMVLGIHPSS